MVKLVGDKLNEDAYLADVAGLHYHLTQQGLAGFEVRVQGFSHKLPLLCQRVFTALASGEFTEAAFEREKEALVRKYRNANTQVSKHTNYNRLMALCAQAFHVDTLLTELETMTLGDVTKLVAEMLKSCHIETLVTGNVTRDEAAALAQTHAQTPLGPGCVAPASIRRRDQCVRLPAGVELMHKEAAKNPEDENCGVEIYFQCTEASSYIDRAHVDMLDQILNEPAYNQLRTKEQLGYTVYTGMRLTHGVLGFCFGVVTSEEADARIEAFIATNAVALMAGFTEEEFAKQKVTDCVADD
ncbi:hypothetical protein FOA52_003954 [Chlamydomonas sp. UWO 241]|nr:hypothetical protein FOA52_003954 [Chlamydomonas sp. UWO 241]